MIVFFCFFLFIECIVGQCVAPTLSGPLTGELGSGGAAPARPADAISPDCSSFVVEPIMQECTSSVVERSGCPHLEPGLEPFPTGLAAGADVTISSRVLFTSCEAPAAALGRIHVVAGGAVIFNDEEDLALAVAEIRVDEGGEVRAGTASCPLFGRLTLKLHGAKGGSSLMLADTSKPSKGIVNRGSLSLVGHRYSPTWTRLAATAPAGATAVHLQQPVNWPVGGVVLVATSTWFDCPEKYGDMCKPCKSWQTCDPQPHQNEVRRVVGLSADGGTVLLDQPLVYEHWADRHYQVEVALLSRHIVIRDGDVPDAADELSVPGHQSADDFGAHLVTTAGADAHVASVECLFCGQLNVEGRYPFHMHLLDNGANSVFEDNSVVHSNFRAYVVHGTNHTRLSRNVCYNVNGNAFYMEDGVEEENLIEFNFAAHVHPVMRPAVGGSQAGEVFTRSADLLVPADVTAAGFYITNPYNNFTGNSASGGWSGYGFPNVPLPLGIYDGLDLGHNNPMNRPTLVFNGNQAHSSGFYWWQGMHYDSGRKERKTKLSNGTEAWMEFINTKVYLCNKGIAHWGDKLNIINYEVADSVVGAMTFGESSMYRTLITGRTGNQKGWISADTTIYARKFCFQCYDTWVKSALVEVTCKNFSEPKDFALSSMTHSDQFLPQGINAVRGLDFIDVPHANRYELGNCGADCGTDYETMSSRMYTMWDFDGTLAGTGRPSIVGSNNDWWNADGAGASCQHDDQLHIWTCDWTENLDIGYFEMKIPNLIDESAVSECASQKARYVVGNMTIFGHQERYIELSPWAGVAGLTQTGWAFRARSAMHGVDGAPNTFQVGPRVQLRRGRFVVLAVRYPAAVTPADITVVAQYPWGSKLETPIPMASSFEGVSAAREDLKPSSEFVCDGSAWNSFCDFGSTGGQGPVWYFDQATGFLYLRVVMLQCYVKGMREDCERASIGYERLGASVPDIINSYSYLVTVNCPSCPVQTTHGGVTYYAVEDSLPPAFPAQRGAVRATPPAMKLAFRPCGQSGLTCNTPPAGNNRPVTTPQPTSSDDAFNNNNTPKPTTAPIVGELGYPCRASGGAACDAPYECTGGTCGWPAGASCERGAVGCECDEGDVCAGADTACSAAGRCAVAAPNDVVDGGPGGAGVPSAPQTGSLVEQPWFVPALAGAGGLLLFLVLAVVLCVVRGRRRQRTNGSYSSNYSAVALGQPHQQQHQQQQQPGYGSRSRRQSRGQSRHGSRPASTRASIVMRSATANTASTFSTNVWGAGGGGAPTNPVLNRGPPPPPPTY